MRTEQSGVIFNIQQSPTRDGEGFRTTVFLKGCPLRCRWCSHPESQHFEPERAYDPGKCLGTDACGRCVEECPYEILDALDGLPAANAGLCNGCLKCIATCPGRAMTVYGERMTVAEALRRVEQTGSFRSRSRGRLLLSGGEPMAQPEFCAELIQDARKRHLRTSMETCGHCMWDPLAKVCGLLDELVFDIKSVSTTKHKLFTRVGNELILQNLRRVCSSFPDLPLLVRTPVVPGFNDSKEDIQGILAALPRRDNLRYELVAYHRMGQSKYAYLGRRYEMEERSLDRMLFRQLAAMVEDWNRSGDACPPPSGIPPVERRVTRA